MFLWYYLRQTNLVNLSQMKKKENKNMSIVKDLELVLSAREGNTNVVGSGGDPNQFLFLATRHTDVVVQPGATEFSMKEDGSLLLKAAEGTPLKDVKEAFKTFYDSVPDKTEFTFEQISDVAFLKEKGLHDYATSMEASLELATLLDSDKELDKTSDQFMKLANTIVSTGHSPAFFGTRLGIQISRLAEHDLDECEPFKTELDYLNDVATSGSVVSA